MEYRRLGKAGLLVSELSLGSWLTFGKQISDETAKECMYAAYDAGVNYFDNAEEYEDGKSEEVMGKILKEAKWPRDTFIVSSKVFWGGDLPNQKGLSRKHIFEGCHASLRRLQVDYLDLFFCHRPDRQTPIEETVRAMDQLIQQGKVLYWGTSEWTAQEIMEAYSVARQFNLTPPTMEQPKYNMFTREKVEGEFFRLYEDIGLGTTTFSPLALGLLTGKYNQGVPEASRATYHTDLQEIQDALTGEEVDQQIEKVKQIAKIADELSISMPKLALLWCLKNPNVSTAITGASKPEQVRDNMDAINFKHLITYEVMDRIEGILNNKPGIFNWKEWRYE